MNLRTLFLNNIAQTSPEPMALEIVKAEGIYLIDANQKQYMDLISGISVSALGHCHPSIVEAVKSQVELYMHTLVYGEMILSPQALLAATIIDNLSPHLDNVYFVNSGTEATEGAMKLAKRFTGRQEIISCKNAYHGSTQGALSLISEAWLTSQYRPLLPAIRNISFNCTYCLDQITTTTAAVIMEPIQAEAGMMTPNEGYLQAVRKRCDEVGALLIFDEIQTGYGKTGNLFAHQKYQVDPDILLLGKAMGGGMPLAAFVASKKIMSTLSENPVLGHITTFGGHPVNCAAGLACLKILLETDLLSKVEAKARLFQKAFKHELIKDFRQIGFLMAIDLDDSDLVKEFIKHGLEAGIITDWFLFNDRSVRLCPPLTINEEEIDKACTIIIAILDKMVATK